MTQVSELGTPVLRAVDRGAFVVALGERLRSEGVPVTFTALAALTEGLEASAPRDLSALYWLARITLVNRHQDLPTFDRVFDQVFRDSALPLGGQAAGPIYRGDPATSEADRGAGASPLGQGEEVTATLPWHTRSREADEDGADGVLAVPELMRKGGSRWDVYIDAAQVAELKDITDWMRDNKRLAAEPGDLKRILAPEYLRKVAPASVRGF